MLYDFPTIRVIDDVLPAIEGRDEFIVAEREGYRVINYVMAKNDTFDMDGPDDVMGALRRECRGLIFNDTGELVRRPFHKFFNIGERVETQTQNIPMDEPYVVFEKMDGSMIAPFMLDGEMRLGTKMGLTDIALDTEEWLRQQNAAMSAFIRVCLRANQTPIFEWVSPDNKIVLNYDRPRLVLLAIRDNLTGKYNGNLDTTLFEMPNSFGDIAGEDEGSLLKYLEEARKDVDREGDIYFWPTLGGHMVKGKNDWYVRIHKVKDQIRTYRHILVLVIENDLDDVKPMLDKTDLYRVQTFEKTFWKAYNAKAFDISRNIRDILDEYEVDLENVTRDNRKVIATEALPKSPLTKDEYAFMFGVLDGKLFSEMIAAKIRSGTHNTAKFESMMDWLGVDYD